MKSISMINITKIKDDTSIQCRVSIDEQNIADIMTALDDTPPIRLFREVQGGEVVYHIGDGWHRKIAHERAGRLLICAIVEEGGLEAALLYAVQANGPKEHGVKRTNADKLKAIAVYLTFKDWYLHSDPMVAKACAVSHHTVEKQRAALELAGTIPVARERLGLDGKIQASQKQVGICQPESNPPRPPDHDASAEMYPREAPTQQEKILSAKELPKATTTKCERWRDGCTRNTHNGGRFCAEHTLLITSPVESSREKMSMYDAAEAKYAKPKETPVGIETGVLGALDRDAPVSTSPVVAGDQGEHEGRGSDRPDSSVVGGSTTPEGKATQSEVDLSVDAYFAKHPPDPKTLLPTQTNSKPDYQHGNTPAWLRNLIREIAPIALDPCHNEHSILGALHTLTKEQDGLSSSHSWVGLSQGKGLVYVNPPYEDVSPWALRAIAEAQDGAEIVLCLPSSHSTGWYKLLRGKCQLLIQLGRKVDFGIDGVYGSTARHETSLFYFGPQAAKVRAIMEREGHDVTSRKEYVAPATEPTPPKEESNTEKLSLPMDRMIAIEQGFLEIRKTNYIREAEEIRDRLLKEAESPGEKTEIQTRWEVWYATRPPAKPYNHKTKEAPITSPLKKGRSR